MFERIGPNALEKNVFSLIGDEWMLVTAGSVERCNTMTASWGGLGVLWGKPAATIYIRPQRYTLEFIEKNDYFTLSFFGTAYRKELALCGSKSGRDMDKIQACGFTVREAEGAPYFEQAQLVLVCKKAYWQDMDPTHFLDPEVEEKWYPEKDYHRMFIGTIEEVLKKK